MDRSRTMLAAAALLLLPSLGANADRGSPWTTNPAEVRARFLVATHFATAGSGNGGDASRATGERRDAAAAVAAFAVLEALDPGQREYYESLLAVDLSRIPETAAKAEGAVSGRRIAEEMLKSER